MIGRLVEAWCLERGVDITPYGSWTHESEKNDRAAEPCSANPEPERCDLAIEAIWTSGALNELEIYRRLAVREVWLWMAGRIEIFTLRGDAYAPLERSKLFPDIDLAELLTYVDIKPMTRAVTQYRVALHAARRPSLDDEAKIREVLAGYGVATPAAISRRKRTSCWLLAKGWVRRRDRPRTDTLASALEAFGYTGALRTVEHDAGDRSASRGDRERSYRDRSQAHALALAYCEPRFSERMIQS